MRVLITAASIQRLPTFHVGLNGAAARGRASLNARLRRRNARLEALDEQMGKLMRMKARLAALIEPKPGDRRQLHVVDDQASDLLLWRRRPQPKMLKGGVSARLAKPGGLEASPEPDTTWNGPRPARRRPGR